MSTTCIHYAREQLVGVADYRRVLVESGLGAFRPVDDPIRLQTMLSGANLIVTARTEEGQLVGIARCMTDGAWNCYVSDLAVSKSAQGLGVGKRLIDEARRQIGPKVSLILSSVPEAVGFYERIGMPRLPDAFWFKRQR
jgi:ribosomal protein S18 acetylase RimI-like enzyme